MREIVLSDHAHHMRPYAVLELGVFELFPEDRPSRDQAMKLLEMEYQRWSSEGSDGFEFSGIVKQILTSSQKKMARRHVVGLVGIAMYCLSNAEKKVSLESAAKIVSEYNNTVGKQTFSILKDGVWVERQVSLTGDISDIKKAFREYRSVAHICAAMTCTADYLTPRTGFELRPEADGCLISTAVYFQNVFRKVQNFDDWNLWEIRFSPPDPSTLAILLPTQQAIYDLMVPWLNSMQPQTDPA